MAIRSSLLDWSAFLPALRQALHSASAPVTATQLRAGLSAKKKPTAADVQALLDDEVARGEFHRWDPLKGTAPRYWTRSPEAAVRPVLLESLAAADEPMTADEYRKRSKLDTSAALVKKLLEELVAAGKCQRYEPVKKDLFRYWAGDPARYARRVMLGVLAKGKGKTAAPLSWAELAKALKSPLKGYSEDALSQVLQDLLDTGEAFKTLKFTAGADRYSTRPPDLVALVRESFADVYKKFAKAGVSAEEVNEAARTILGGASPPAPADLGSEVLRAFTELKRERYGHSGLVPIPALRRSIAARVSPAAARHDVLDDVIQGLVKDGKLNIIPLNDATGVSVEECNDAIPGIQETWYYLEAR